MGAGGWQVTITRRRDGGVAGRYSQFFIPTDWILVGLFYTYFGHDCSPHTIAGDDPEPHGP